MKVRRAKLKWTVIFEVDPLWVADGFNIDDEKAFHMLNLSLPWARVTQELRARVIEKPSIELIKGLQSGNIGFPGDDEGN